MPLVLLVLGLVAAYRLFAERVARDSLEEAVTKLLGTAVDVASLDIRERETGVALAGVAIADPFDPMRNLLEADSLWVQLDPGPLLERKYIVQRLAIHHVRVGTRRTRAARAVSGTGFAPQALREMRRWRAQFDVPLLTLTPLDTVRDIILDPRQLLTVQRALALKDGADSLRRVLTAGYEGLRLRETLDSTRALAERLRDANPLKLGVSGTRQAIADVRRAAARVDSAKKRVEQLAKGAKAGAARLREGALSVDSARRADYAFAKSLLKLPTIEAPDIGGALFGPVTLDRVQRLVYWSELARAYVPPGLQPRVDSGPERARAAGLTVHFVAPKTYPSFLIRRGDADFAIDGNALTGGRYRLTVADVTGEPALVGRPLRFVLTRTGGASGVELRAAGMMDRRTASPRDSVLVRAAGIPVPAFDLPGVPFRVDPGRARSELAFARAGDRLDARWLLRAPGVVWHLDSARARRANYVESLVYRVIAGLTDLDLEATVTGTLAAPRLAVRSNLDRALADRVRAVVGEEVKKAEVRVRAAVDRLVDEHAEPLKARAQAEADSLRADAEARLAEATQRLEAERRKLEDRLRQLAPGVKLPEIPGIKLPEVKIPDIKLPRASRPPRADSTAPPDSSIKPPGPVR